MNPNQENQTPNNQGAPVEEGNTPTPTTQTEPSIDSATPSAEGEGVDTPAVADEAADVAHATEVAANMSANGLEKTPLSESEDEETA